MRVAVYGHDRPEKDKLIKKLQGLSDKFHFESSTPSSRYAQFNLGQHAPVYTSNYQLLLIDLNDKRLEAESLPSIPTLFHQCDFYRPLVILFYGDIAAKAKLIADYRTELKDEEFVHTIASSNIDDIYLENIIQAFHELDKKHQAHHAASHKGSPIARV